jgi:pyruvate dehydrogenase E2 component (dihydrolipoamide acetyltransferase)
MSPDVLRMPRLSDSMEEATIVGWLKQPGEAFARGEPLVEVETDKATIVYEAEADGVITEILVGDGGTAALGEPIARLNGDEASGADEIGEETQAAESPRVETEGTPAPPRVAITDGVTTVGARARATPVARRTAAELGLSLHGLTGTGPGGRIRKLDVLRASGDAAVIGPTGGELKGATTVVPLSTTGRTIARRMTESRSQIPSFEVVVQADMTAIVELRRGASDVVDLVPSVNDFIVKAVALTLRANPRFNSSFVDGRPELHARVNVGIAVATEETLLVPAVLDADTKSLGAIAAETRELVARANNRQLSPEDLTASTFTVSNLGMFGVSSFTAVINAPQVAILAVGAAIPTPVETDSGVEFRDVATLTLTSDHRAVYGADAARFLAHLRQLLEHPLALVL